MTETTPRLALPFIVPGQAQKEMTHNEALALLAIAVQASVVDIGVNVPPADPTIGDCWAVGSEPVGAWTGRARAIAGWTAGGWRFVAPHPGFAIHVAARGAKATFLDDDWRFAEPAPAIAAPTGGDVVDTQARTAIGAILAALQSLDLLQNGM
ncbi:MAG: DUF2793 domain-containing protein [Sphingomonadales bacterium]|nr:DUF2793 domain-containing protein [Sphingomonadales bacterium]